VGLCPMLMGGNNVTRKPTLDEKDLLQCKLKFSFLVVLRFVIRSSD
jgi:hypothetical protein